MTNLSLENFENGVKLYQDNTLYKFTSDSIKLAKFCNIKSSDNVLDMCAGCGVVGLYVYSLCKCNSIVFNEIQPKMCDLIEKNIHLNSLEGKCKVLCKDLALLKLQDFDKPLDVIVCNPPYFKLNGKVKQDDDVAMCRHEINTNLSTIIAISKSLIKDKGKFYFIIPADRMCEAIELCEKNMFKIKRMEIYHSKSQATVCLMEAIKGAKDGVKIKVLKE